MGREQGALSAGELGSPLPYLHRDYAGSPLLLCSSCFCM